MEGFLPARQAIAWTAVSAPFIAWGVLRLKREVTKRPEMRLLLGASGGFAFVLSSLKLPSVTGSCSHPTGLGLGTILFGPGIMSALGFVVLLFQALFLAHGGITTLGANTFSMAIVGSFVAWMVYRISTKIKIPFGLSVFLSAALANLMTYVVTALQLALAFPDPMLGFSGAATKFLGIFAITQIPLAISEGLLTVLVANLLHVHASDLIGTLLPSLAKESVQ